MNIGLTRPIKQHLHLRVKQLKRKRYENRVFQDVIIFITESVEITGTAWAVDHPKRFHRETKMGNKHSYLRTRERKREILPRLLVGATNSKGSSSGCYAGRKARRKEGP